MSRYPQGNVFYRKTGWEYPRIVSGEGCWIVDEQGKRYLDACGGAFVSNLGHGVVEIADAMAAQARRLAYVSGMTLTHDAVEEFASELASEMPGDLDRVYPLSSGSDAVEAALKLARQYCRELGDDGKRGVIALSPSYHGNTLLALSASAREHYRTAFGGWLVEMHRVPAYDVTALEEVFAAHGSESCALIVEPVGGSSTGALVPSEEFLARARSLCDQHGVLFIADEILVGAGRTGTFSAIEPFEIVPDLAIVGKGIAAGFAPLAAVVAPRRITDVVARSGGLNHAQTFSHHAVSCAAGTATLRYMRQHGLVERCRTMGSLLHERLQSLASHANVGFVRGGGLLAGIEIVADRETREPFTRELRVAERLTRDALDNGLLIWPNVGHHDGHEGDLVMIAPPYVVSAAEIDQILVRLVASIDSTIGKLTVKT